MNTMLKKRFQDASLIATGIWLTLQPKARKKKSVPILEIARQASLSRIRKRSHLHNHSFSLQNMNGYIVI
jgi:hypothetical protein